MLIISCARRMWSRSARSLCHGSILRGSTLAKRHRQHMAIQTPGLTDNRLFMVRYSTSTNGGNAASSGTREAVAATAVAAGGIQNKQPPEHMSPLWTTPRPLFISGRKICALSLSEVMGHLSFLFMGLGYLETELLPLRVYAAAGICCSTAFQYYRPQPLWIPISWNAIFLVINGSMVCLLLKEDHDARRQDEEAAALYDEVFREAGLALVDFMKIHALAKTLRRCEGDALTKEGVTQDKLYLVVDGGLRVLKQGMEIATAHPGEFVGEMSFLQHVRRECDGRPEGCNCAAVADVQVQPGGAKLVCWNFDELRELLAQNSSMSVAFHGALARAVASKLMDTHDPAFRYRQLLQGVLVDGVVTPLEKEELEKMRIAMRVDDERHRQELELAGWTTAEFDQGYHDEETQEYEKLMRDVLKNGTVDEKGRARLRDHRYEHSVDSNHHLRVLRKLGWSMDDFEEGKRGLHPPVVQHRSSPKALQRMSTFVTQVLATVENDSADDDDTNEADTDIGGGSC